MILNDTVQIVQMSHFIELNPFDQRKYIKYKRVFMPNKVLKLSYLVSTMNNFSFSEKYQSSIYFRYKKLNVKK